MSAGQAADAPVQVSAASQPLAMAARQTVPALPGLCTQAGAPEIPLHRSVVQTLPSSVHAVAFDLTASAGQALPAPSQLSARSHSFAAPRHCVPFGDLASLGQRPEAPVQTSCGSQTPAEPRQSVPFGERVSAGHAADAPVQASAGS